MGVVAERARAAYGEMEAAQVALAESDWQGSYEHFGTAGDLLTNARAEFRAALTSSSAVVDYIDVTGAVRSGDQLLAAGEAMVAAGSELSRGMALLVEAKVVPSADDEPTQPTLADALEEALGSFKKAHSALADAEQSLGRVTTMALPGSLKEPVRVMQEKIPAARGLLREWLDQSQVLLAILGSEHERQYLIVFQNNHELRPTGGFIGSLGLVNIDRGVVEAIDVQTVYDGDGQLKEFIAPPEPLLPITNRWYLRDANWFADYPTSAEKIVNFFEKEGGPTVDGVIALTPEVIKQLLVMTGPIAMPEYDVVIDADSFVPLTQDLVTYSYDKEVNQPKQFLADLTPVLLNKIFADKTDVMGLLSVLSTMAQEKQLLVYFTDADEQERIVRQGWDGSLPQQPNFLSVVNANIGGHKSDQFMTQEIDYRLSILPGGETEALVTIRRTHHGPTEKLDLPYPADNNPAFKDNVIYQRVFMPKGAELLEATGFTPVADVPRYDTPEEIGTVVPDPDVAEWQRLQQDHPSGTTIGQEGGHQYFANWIITKPGATSIGLYRYRLPSLIALPQGLTAAETVAAYIAKQPGDNRTELRAEIRFPKELNIVHTVPNDGVTSGDEGEVVYRGALRTDVLFGVVVEKN